jgi:hypothetical protein
MRHRSYLPAREVLGSTCEGAPMHPYRTGSAESPFPDSTTTNAVVGQVRKSDGQYSVPENTIILLEGSAEAHGCVDTQSVADAIGERDRKVSVKDSKSPAPSFSVGRGTIGVRQGWHSADPSSGHAHSFCWCLLFDTRRPPLILSVASCATTWLHSLLLAAAR